MARLRIADPKIQELIKNDLIPVFFGTGSVNAMCDWLNVRLGQRGIAEKIYPNRLHAIFSDDPGKSLNETTVELIEKSVTDHQKALDPERSELNQTELRGRLVPLWQSAGPSVEAITALAERLSIPPAVVRFILEQAGLVVPVKTSLLPAPSRENSSQQRPPDWSFQEDAVRCCVQALLETKNRKVGLVLPTGGTKTRVALRTAFTLLGRTPTGKVVWVTHRKNLRRQAHIELQKMLSAGVPGIPADAAALLADRIDIIMVGQVEAYLANVDEAPVLTIVDEGHHAAAQSYQPIFETSYALRALFLTATPNRTDGLPIGIDRVAFTMTYRELADRGVILIPHFEDFPVDDFDWSSARIKDLADAVIERAANDFTKTLVLAPRIDRVEEFYQALIERLAECPGHPLSPDDIGFAHGSANSHGCTNDEFLALFVAKPRAICVSAQLLIEGFDDPSINAVVITYPSQSLVQLMQAAGRCVRYAPGKHDAYVVQARCDRLAYHFDHRWLYQEISDELRPSLQDFSYANLNQLRDLIDDVLRKHNVPEADIARINSNLENVAPGTTCRLLLSGLPYFDSRDQFEHSAEWKPLLEITQNSDEFRWIFNDCCARVGELSDPTDLLLLHAKRFGFVKSYQPNSKWRDYMDMLLAMSSARKEVYADGSRIADGVNRPFVQHGSTTWLKYLTFHFQPVTDPAFQQFLEGCHNAEAIISAFIETPHHYRAAIKLPVPLGGCHAWLLDTSACLDFENLLRILREAMGALEPEVRTAALAGTMDGLCPQGGLPYTVLRRLERFLEDNGDNLIFWLPAGITSNADAD